MNQALRAEFRKIFSVRSTYIILGLCLIMELIFAFYAVGWHTEPKALLSPTYLASQVLSAVTPISLLISVIAVLLVTHEYRYNTISYTLTSSNSRIRVLSAKLVAISCFSLLFIFLFALLSPLLSLLAIHIRDLHLASQNIDVWNLVWRSALSGWGFMALSFILASIIRIQVGAVAAMFLIPSTIESLLGQLLKDNQVYLPYSSFGSLLNMSGPAPGITYTHIAIFCGIYAVVGVAISFLLFARRDAS